MNFGIRGLLVVGLIFSVISLDLFARGRAGGPAVAPRPYRPVNPGRFEPIRPTRPAEVLRGEYLRSGSMRESMWRKSQDTGVEKFWMDGKEIDPKKQYAKKKYD